MTINELSMEKKANLDRIRAVLTKTLHAYNNSGIPLPEEIKAILNAEIQIRAEFGIAVQL